MTTRQCAEGAGAREQEGVGAEGKRGSIMISWDFGIF